MNPGHVALVCITSVVLPFEAYEIDTGRYVPTWEAYSDTLTLPIYTYDDVDWTIPAGDCEGNMFVLVWLPENPTGINEVPEENHLTTHEGCGKIFSINKRP